MSNARRQTINNQTSCHSIIIGNNDVKIKS